MKLLVAIDASHPSQQVVDEVARRPWPTGTNVCVLHVVDWAQVPSNPVLIHAIKQSAAVLVKSAAEKIAKVGIPAIFKVLEGHPRIAIADYAKKWDADFLLIGSHSAGPVARFLLGSTAQAALRKSPCSIEIVRRSVDGTARESAATKILIATDGSECSMAAVKSVAVRPWPQRSEIRMISAVPIIALLGEGIPMGPGYYPPPEVMQALQQEIRDRAEDAVARGRLILTEANIEPVEINSCPIGDPRQVILDQARDWGADLIVVGSHGYRGIDRLMLGSVSEAVAMHAHCSVEVIRESRLRRQ